MNGWQITVLALYGVVVALAAVRHILLHSALVESPVLTPENPRMRGQDLPRVSIMIPAKDEEGSIEGCLRSLLAQEYPNFEVLVADDRSEDRTAEIVERIARDDSRVRLIRVDHLPPGWTGKTHALHLCQQQATGEWYLFVDADTRHHPATLGVILFDAIDHKVQLESTLVSLSSRTFWEKVVQPFAGACLMVMYPLPRVNRDERPLAAFANGQFILVGRDAYRAIGGHEAVRDKFVEDIQLGRLIRQHGMRLRVVFAPELSSVRMYSSLRGIVHGWSRILYSAVDFRPARLYGLFASICFFSVLSYAVLIVAGGLLLAGHASPFLKTLFGMGVVHQVLQTTLMARIYGLSHSSRRYLVFRILAVFVMLYILARTIRMCRTHQVYWRGRVYDRELHASGP